MSKRNQNIEDWLRQAAAQDPEVSPDQIKQQAWGQLSNMLDREEAPSLPRRAFGSGWWTIVMEALILVGAFTYLQITGTEKINKHNTPLHIKEQKQQIISISEKEHSISPFTEEQYSSDTIAAMEHSSLFANDAISPSVENNHPPFSGIAHFAFPFKKGLLPFNPTFANIKTKISRHRPSEVDGHNNPISANTKTSRNRLSAADRHNKPKPASEAAAFSINKRPGNSRSSTSAVYWNTDPLEKDPSGPEQKRSLKFADGNSTQGPKAIRMLTTKQLFVPVKDSGVQHAPTPKVLRPHRERKERSSYSLRLAAILPIAEAYGAAANIEYTYQWKKEWRIRPYIGAEYLTGFNKVYNHISAISSENGGGGTGFYKTDSVFTHFTLNSLFYGKAGVQAVYVLPRWEIAAGIEYRYLINVGGKDTSKTVTVPGGVLPSKQQPIAFNRKQVTGSGNARLQLGLDYNISHRLQIGVDYYMQLNRKSLDSSYRVPHSKMPDQHSFQVHARYFIRKK